MTDRKRDPLPEGYQFGDARHCGHAECGPLRCEYAPCAGWNVTEGDHFASDAERHAVVEGFSVDRDHGDETTT